jgi:choline-sulfatase
MAGEHGLWWKRTYYEASARVPLLIYDPDVARGETQSVPVELVDLFPTCCDWAGISIPDGLDGESLVPLLTGNPDGRRKRMARSELLGGKPQTRFRMVREGSWKAVDFPDAPPRLFDLVDDPDEVCDLADTGFSELLSIIAQGGDWDRLEEMRNADRKRAGNHECLSGGAVQYRLADGRVVDADANLYEKEL